ncbi:MAG: pilus assembly protein [Anaerolinea sp.]|nr:pilus assembly protein [Anaerolinea sp.]
MIRRHNQSQGQAIVEFALIITVLLMMIFLIVESARILQGWVTVQNAARVGARYAITGQNMGNCPLNGANLPKFAGVCVDPGSDWRMAAVISMTHGALAGLPLNEDPNSNAFRDIDGNPPDENSYHLEVYGGYVGLDGMELRPGAGEPGQPVIVRALYNVPIITPFFRPIISFIPVFGQVTMNNENFGSLGNPTQGLGLPPNFRTPIPTVGATPTPSATPTATETPEGQQPPTETPTETVTPTATPAYCGAFFEAAPVEGQNHVWVAGEVGATVTIIDLTTGQTLGSDIFLAASNHRCAGFADFNDAAVLTTPLVLGHVILAVPSLGEPTTAIVLAGTPTPTSTPTQAATSTSAPTETPTITPTPTPSGPYIVLIPSCSIGSDAQFNVLGFNWPTTQAIALSWDGFPQSIVPSGHGGSFSQTWVKNNLTVGTTNNPTLYMVRAQSNTHLATAVFRVPCENVPPPTFQPTFTPTPNPADLIVVGPPQLLSTPPLVAYQPISVRVVISNTGELAVSSQFFVDIFLNPTGPVSPTISLNYSIGYMGVSSLAGGASRVITITAPLGFHNPPPDTHLLYGMVDSLLQASESDETNNVSTPLAVSGVTPAPTPTPSPTAPTNGTESISGIVRSLITSWVPAGRATVILFDSDNNFVATTTSDRNGFYIFSNIFPGDYNVRACTYIDNISFSGLRTGITATDPFANVYMVQGPCS